MILTPHILVGAAIGTKTDNLWLVFVFGWLSHYALDALPHWEYLDKLSEVVKTKNLFKIFADFIIGIAVVLAITWHFSQKLPIFFGLLGAITPDILQGMAFVLKLNCLKPLNKLHNKIHNSQKLSLKQGWLVLILTFLVAILIIYL